MSAMANMTAATAAFLLFHLVPSSPARAPIVRLIGRAPYLILFSVISIALMGWWALAFRGLRISPDVPIYWQVGPVTRYVQIAIQFVAFQFMVAGSLTPKPNNSQDGGLDRPGLVSGMLRITRHPFLWGLAIWAGGHLLVNGDVGGLIFFGAMAALAIFGTVSIDARRRRELGAKWLDFEARTSSVPFAAILQGRQSLNLGEIGLWRAGAAAALWAGAASAHPYVIGLRVWP